MVLNVKSDINNGSNPLYPTIQNISVFNKRFINN